MRRLLTTGILAAALTVAGAGTALAHEQDPGGANGQGEGVGFIPAHGPQGHEGIQCAAEAGSPTFPEPLDLTCHKDQER